jgi:hypothetical protein
MELRRMAAPVHRGIREMLNKVPEVTLIFWIIKVMATTVGETGATSWPSTWVSAPRSQAASWPPR